MTATYLRRLDHIFHGSVEQERRLMSAGVPDELWGESVKAVVALRDGCSATEQDLIDECLAHLASYKKPASVEFVLELPKNAYGKVLKRELRVRYWAGLERKI